MNVGSLFSGIGGFDLGLERAGFRTSWFCEQDEFCQHVLAKHWPGVPCYPDITELRGADVESVDVLCGGFPCQDLSVAGKGAGLDGARSGLWSEYARLIGELQPRYVIVENVSALLARGMGRVLGDLAALGYDAEWDCIPASAVGAPHRRDRVWLVAYPNGDDGGPRRPRRSDPGRARQRESVAAVADADGERAHRSGAQHEGREESADGSAGRGVRDADNAGRSERRRAVAVRPEHAAVERGGEGVGNTDRVARQAGVARKGRPGAVDEPGAVERTVRSGGPRRTLDEGRIVDNPGGGRHGAPEGSLCAGRDGVVDAGWWLVEPDVGRVANGVPARVDRLRSLGNALVPQIAEWIGRRVMAYEEAA